MSAAASAPAGSERPEHNYLLFGKDPGEEAPTYAHAAEMRADFLPRASRVAALLRRADALLIGAGAGFSADSGLATYKDVAKVAAWQKAGLTYYDLCQIGWIYDDPAVFFGFWGHCLDAYRRHRPHEGYRTIRRWADELVSRRAGRFRKVFDAASMKPCFVYTSNVDHHWCHEDVSGIGDVVEFHGTVEEWCCSGAAASRGLPRPCCRTVWTVPADFAFNIDEATMRAESSTDGNSAGVPLLAESSDKAGTIQQNPFEAARDRGDNNRPRCPLCGSLLRPRVLMFGDAGYFDREGDVDRFDRWTRCVWDCMELCEAPLGDRDVSEKEADMKKHVLEGSEARQDSFCLALLEFGCGLNVPTIRRRFESMLDMYPENCVLVRVNPDFPLALDYEPRQCVEVMSGSVELTTAVERLLTMKRAPDTGAKAKAKAKGKSTASADVRSIAATSNAAVSKAPMRSRETNR